MRSLSAPQIRRLRLRAQRLSPGTAPAAGAAQILRDVCCIQAQDMFAAALALRVRGKGLQAADVQRALSLERSLVRTWCMRGTLHLLAAEDLGWLLPLFGPLFISKSRRRYAELDLDEATLARSVPLIRDALTEQGPLTRAELAAELAAGGIPTAGQAIIHALGHAAMLGVICYGPDRAHGAKGGQETFVALDKWIATGDSPLDSRASGGAHDSASRAEVEGMAAHQPATRETSLARLARRYWRAYGPAAPEDLASWSGLPVGDVRVAFAGIQDELVEIAGDGLPYWILAEQEAWLDEPEEDRPQVRLLPAFDAYLLGYRDRELSVPAAHARQVHPGGGIIRPALLVDGAAAGVWSRSMRKKNLVIRVEPFAPLPRPVVAALEEEVEDVGRFLGTAVALALQ
jgi:hypothetical protein